MDGEGLDCIKLGWAAKRAKLHNSLFNSQNVQTPKARGNKMSNKFEDYIDDTKVAESNDITLKPSIAKRLIMPQQTNIKVIARIRPPNKVEEV